MRKNLLAILRGGESQLSISKRYGVSQQTWSSWENGRTQPELSVMLRLQEEYDIPIEVIFFNSAQHKKACAEEGNLQKAEEEGK